MALWLVPALPVKRSDPPGVDPRTSWNWDTPIPESQAKVVDPALRFEPVAGLIMLAGLGATIVRKAMVVGAIKPFEAVIVRG